MFQILIVDGDKNIRRYFSSVLSHAGYQPRCAESAADAYRAIEQDKADLIVTAAIMPGIDGFTMTQALRECKNDVPILMIAPKHMGRLVKRGFLAGVDDYMTAPVDEDEFLLRIRALLRRARTVSERKLQFAGTTLFYDTLTIFTDGTETLLPQKEFHLLYELLSYPDHIFTRVQLMDDIWGPCSESTAATISVHINRLRTRFRQNPDFEIQTIRGLGYRAHILSGKVDAMEFPSDIFSSKYKKLRQA